MNDRLQQGFRIGRWTVRPRAGRLFIRWPRPVVQHVEPKAMQVLIALVESPGEFVSKEALLNRVWSGRTVGDDCLTVAIHALRQALGDNARDPRFIETRINVGYRVIADVGPERSPRALAAAAGLAIVAVSILLGWLALSPRPDAGQPGMVNTIAVLPFQNLSGSDADTYLAASLTDALIANLSERSGLRVISRTSVQPYAGGRHGATDIADRLGANLLVEGSVQSQDGHARVVARLIEPASETPIWAEQYDRGMENILALQGDISHAIARQIGIAAGLADVEPATTLSAAEQASFMRARYDLAQGDPDTVLKALATFQELAAVQPDFAPAHLARAQSMLFLFKSGRLGIPALHAAADSIDRYESLAGADAASHRCMGQVSLILEWDFADAEHHYRHAILASPSDTIARRRYAWMLVAQQRFDEAKTQIAQTLLIDPLYYENGELATLLLLAGEIDESISEFERLDVVTELDKVDLRTLAFAYLAAGREAEARRSLARIMREANAGEAVDVTRWESAGLEELFREMLDSNPFRSAIVSAGFQVMLGDTEGALDDLEAALDRRDPSSIFLATLPELRSLHSHPRFRAMLAEIGLLAPNQRLTSIRFQP